MSNVVTGLAAASYLDAAQPVAWTQDFNGFRVDVRNQRLLELVSRRALFDGGLLHATPEKRTLIGLEPAIRFHVKNGVDVDAAIDLDGKLTDAVIDPDGQHLRYHFYDYSSIDGRRFPKTWTAAGQSVSIDDVVVPATQPDVPSEYVGPSFGDAKWYPISWMNRDWPVIDAQVNGAPARLLVDSGSSLVVLSRNLIEASHPFDLGVLFAPINGRWQHLHMYRLRSLQVAGLDFKDLVVAQIDPMELGPGDNITTLMPRVFEWSTPPVVPGTDGTLGFPLFARARILLDTVNDRLKAETPRSGHFQGLHLAMETDTGVPVVPATRTEKGIAISQIRALIDTGRTGAAGYTPTCAGAEARPAWVTMAVASFIVPAKLDCSPKSQAVSPQIQANAMIGTRSFNGSVLIFDYPNYLFGIMDAHRQ